MSDPISNPPVSPEMPAGFQRLMLALSETTPDELNSDILIGLAAMFFKLGAEAIRREP